MSTGKKINEITATATSFAADDYLPIAGAANGTRKISASTLGALATAPVTISTGVATGTPSEGAIWFQYTP